MNKKYLWYIGCLAIGVIVGFSGERLMYEPSAASVSVIRAGADRFTNPLLEYDYGQYISEGLTPFKRAIEKVVNEKTQAGKVEKVAVYFRDLNNGPWFGINEQEQYFPVSLMKLPLMISYFKAAEANPNLLDFKIKYEQELMDNFEFVKPKERLALGKEYTVHELIERSILYSDNVAATLLSQRMDTLALPLERVLKIFDVDFTLNANDKLSVKRYSSFFRILFNASYLNQEMSEKALDLLTRSDFKDGLAAGVPTDVPVAHKFGERPNAVSQFHDCGIVYYPAHPYLLCIMSRGKNFEDLIATVRDISQLTYKEVNEQYSQ